MKAHFFDTSDPISIIGFLATFKFACDTNRIHERADMWVLYFCEENILASILISRMSAAFNNTPAVAFIRLTEPLK